MVSAITERPYTFLRWPTGTLPGRKPLRRTLSLRSTRRASALASRSDAGTLIWNSCFNPSASVSVTCMVDLLLLWSGRSAAHCQFDRRRPSRPLPAGSVEQDAAGQPSRRNRPPEIIRRKRYERLVRAEGLEPPQLSLPEPKSGAS